MSEGGPLRLENEEFWGDYRRTEDEVKAWMDETSFRGLLLDAPGRVPLDRRDTVPVLGWWVRTLREDLVLDADSRALIAAVDLDTNELRLGLALDSGKTPDDLPPPGGLDPGEGLTRNMFDLDLMARLDLPHRPARYRVTMILADRRSNPATVEIVPSTSGYRDPEVESFVDDRRKRRRQPPPSPVFPPPTRGPIPGYARETGTPPMPASEGISLALEPETEGVDLMRVLRGSFRLPALRRERVREDWYTGERPDVGDAKATAVIPIHLVLTGADAVGPWVLRLNVPVYDEADPEDESALFMGYFNVDLYAHPSVPERSGTYYLHALSGRNAVGPVPIKVE